MRQSTNTISLAGILSSLSSESLNTHTTPLLRDLSRHYLDFPLRQPVSVEVSNSASADGTPSVYLSIFPLSPSIDTRRSILFYLKALFDFLNTHLFPSFPGTSAQPLLANLRWAAATGLVNVTIRNALPSNLSDLSDFLEFLDEAVELEKSHLLEETPGGVVGPAKTGIVASWAKDVAEHFGEKRQTDHLVAARSLILSNATDPLIRVDAPASAVEKSVQVTTQEAGPSIIPVQGGDAEDGEEDAWDFDDATEGGGDTEVRGSAVLASNKKVEDAEGWDFDDESGDPSAAKNSNGAGIDRSSVSSKAQDDSGWDSGWDSAWDDDPVPNEKPPSPVPSPAAPVKAPRVAKGLEKFTSKTKQKYQGRVSPSPSATSSSRLSTTSSFPASSSTLRTSPTPVSPSPSTFSSPRSPLPTSQPGPTHKRSNGTLASKPAPVPLSQPTPRKETETYVISGRAQDLIKLIFRILDEGTTVSQSASIFSISCEDAQEAATTASIIIAQAAPAALALFRAVYPVAHASELAHSTRALRFANECAYVACEVGKGIGKAAEARGGVRDQLKEEAGRLEVLGEWWFDEGIVSRFHVAVAISMLI